jgi:ABC-2 type transport system permease protein
VLRSVLGRALHARRRSMVGWTLGVAALTGMIIGFWPMVPEAPELEGLLDAMPEGMMAAFGMAEIDDLFSPAGYLDSQLLALMSPLVLMIFGIGAGAQAIAGDEDRGTLEILLAQPISRRRVLLERAAAVGLLLTGLVAVHGAVLTGGGALVDLRPSAEGLVAIHVSLLLLTALFAAIALTIGAATGRRGLAIAVSAAIGVLAYVVDSFAPIVDWLETIRPASPFYLYRGAQPLEEGLHAPHALALLAAIVVVLVVALVTFERRDVGT